MYTIMWLEDITPKVPKNYEHIDKINEVIEQAQYPLVVLVGASGVGKSLIQDMLVKDWMSKMKRATSRPQKDRDSEWDFEYFSKNEIEAEINRWNVLFPYSNYSRKDWYKYWLLYEELKKLKYNLHISVMWVDWLYIKNYIPVIICSLIRDSVSIEKGLKARPWDTQTQLNINSINETLYKPLKTPKHSQLIVENIDWNPQFAGNKIKNYVDYLMKYLFIETKNVSHKSILNTIFFLQSYYFQNCTEDQDNNAYWDFREDLKNFLISDNYVDITKLEELVNYMCIYKFQEYDERIKYMKKHSKKINKDDTIYSFYKETASLIYELWFKEEAKSIMLQIWENTTSFENKKEIEPINSTKVPVKTFLSEMGYMYDYYEHNKETKTILFVHNSYAFWYNIYALARNTFSLLLKTEDINLMNANHIGSLHSKIKLSKPYKWVEYIEYDIVKDKV